MKAAAPPPKPPPPPAPPREMGMPKAAEVSADGVYLLDAGSELVLWVGSRSAPGFLRDLFGTERPVDGVGLQPPHSSEAAGKLHALVGSLRKGRPGFAPLRVVVHGSKEQGRFFSRLFGDGYDAFCMQVQGEVGKELSGL